MILAACAALAALTPADRVNPIIGTTGPAGVVNYGGVCPWVTPPHGMTHWTPMTQLNGISREPYRSEQRTIIGFMATHQPTVWMGDYGFLTLMPEVGERMLSPGQRGREMAPGSETSHPYGYAVRLLPRTAGQAAVGVTMTATARCGLLAFDFPAGLPAHVWFEMGRLEGYEGWAQVSADRREIVGWNSGRHNTYKGRHMGPELAHFRGYYVIQFEQPFDSFATWKDDAIDAGQSEVRGERCGAFASYAPGPARTVRVRIGSSFISLDQARDNLRRELPGFDVGATEQASRREWNRLLNRVSVEGGTADEQTVFYTALYHALLFPRRFDEYGRYYSAFDEKIHAGVSYNDYSMWDTFRALHPLLTLADPEEVSPMVRSLLQMYAEGGWMPKWPNPTYTNIMIGTPADAIIADAYTKGFRDYDLGQAWAAVRKDAFTPPDGDTHKRWADRAEWTSYEARAGLTYYQTLGYVPADKTNESVSCTLEYAFEDACAARLAEGLGHADEARRLRERAQNYRRLYDPATGLMQARLSDGSLYRGDPRHFHPFTEGSPWTYLFCVMQDVPGLISLMGRDGFIAQLDENFSGGHYAYDNEPENHYPYLYDWVGQPEKGQRILTEVVRRNYRNTPDGITGNDDCGQMSAWYLFTAMGFYPVAPGSGEYALGRPFFPRIVLHLTWPRPHDFTIVARNWATGNDTVKEVRLDGRVLQAPFLKHADLLSGHRLEFVMTPSRS